MLPHHISLETHLFNLLETKWLACTCNILPLGQVKNPCFKYESLPVKYFKKMTEVLKNNNNKIWLIFSSPNPYCL